MNHFVVVDELITLIALYSALCRFSNYLALTT